MCFKMIVKDQGGGREIQIDPERPAMFFSDPRSSYTDVGFILLIMLFLSFTTFPVYTLYLTHQKSLHKAAPKGKKRFVMKSGQFLSGTFLHTTQEMSS